MNDLDHESSCSLIDADFGKGDPLIFPRSRSLRELFPLTIDVFLTLPSDWSGLLFLLGVELAIVAPV
jgi:hypothetical protein